MPQFETWASLKAKVERDLDIQGEVFVRPDELLGYANEAIDEAEAEIFGLNQDYFLARSSITLQMGQKSYTLPSNIFAKKIRRIVYNTGTSVYPVTHMRDWHKFESLALDDQLITANIYQYMLVNTTPGSPEILISPSPSEQATLDVWYIRNANRLTGLDSDIIDIPECLTFLTQFIKVRVYEKEGHPNFAAAVSILEQQRNLMRQKLADSVPDADNTIEGDYGIYTDMN